MELVQFLLIRLFLFVFNVWERTDCPISSEKVSIRQILAGPVHILHLREEVQVVLVEVQVEELSRHV